MIVRGPRSYVCAGTFAPVDTCRHALKGACPPWPLCSFDQDHYHRDQNHDAGYTNYYYLDPTFGGLDWPRAFQDTLKATYDAKSAGEVRALTRDLVKQLKDPFTRILDTPAAAVYQAETSGKVRPMSPLAQDKRQSRVACEGDCASRPQLN